MNWIFKKIFINIFLLALFSFSLVQLTYAAWGTKYSRHPDHQGWDTTVSDSPKGTVDRHTQAQDNSIDKAVENIDNKPKSKDNNKDQTTTPTPSTNNIQGVDLSCLGNGWGKCGVNIYKMLGIRKSNPNITVENFVQDIVVSATKFFWVFFSFVVFFSGFLYILSAMKGSESLESKAKSWITWGIIGLLFVSWSFAIVRFIQFLAQGGS